VLSAAADHHQARLTRFAPSQFHGFGGTGLFGVLIVVTVIAPLVRS